MKYGVLFTIIAFAFSSVAVAQEQQADQEPAGTKVRIIEDKMADKEDMGDQSRIICRKVQETGSRLRAKKICASAAEWAAQKQQNREVTERTQAARYKNN